MSENGNERIVYHSDSSNFQPSTSRTSPSHYLDTSLTLAEKESLYSQPSAYGYEQAKYNIDPTKSKGVTWIFNHKAAYEAVTKTSEAEQHFYQLERSASKLSKLGYYDCASGRWTSKNKIVKRANRDVIEHSSITHATKSTYNRIIPYDLMHNDSEQDFFMAKPHRPKFAAFPTIEEYYSDKYRNVRNWANVDPCWFFKNGANITEQKERLLKAYKDTRQRFIDFLRKPELEKIENRRFIEIQPNANVLFTFHHLEMHIMGFISFFESPSGNIILWDCYHRHFYPMFRIVCQNNEIIIESDWTFQDKNFFKYCMLRGMHYLDRQSRFPNEIPKQDLKFISRETQQKPQSKDSKYGETRTQLEQKNAAIDCISETRFFPLIPYNIVNGQLSLVLPKNNLSYRTHTSRNALPVVVFPLIINEYAYEFFPNPNYVEYAIERRSDETDIEDDYILSQRSVQKYRMAYKIATPEDSTSREAYTLLFVELIENAERIHKGDAVKLNKGPIKVNTGNGKYTNLMNTVNTHHILQIPIKLEKILERKLENYRITYGRQAIPNSLKDLEVELSTAINSTSSLYKLNYSSLEVDNEPKMYTETRVLDAATPIPYADYIKKLSSRHSVSFGNIRIKGVTNVPEVTAYAEKAFSGAWQFSSPRLNLTPSPYRNGNRYLPTSSRQGTSSLQFIRLPQSEAARIYFNSANNKRTTYIQSANQTTPRRAEMHIRKELQQQRATTSRGEIYPKARITSMEQNRILSEAKSLKIAPKLISSMQKQTEEADLSRKTTKELTPNTTRSLVQQIAKKFGPNQNNSSNMTAAQIRNQYLNKEMPNGQPSLKRSLEKLPSIRGRKVARANSTPKIINKPEESNQNDTGRESAENISTIDISLACNELDSSYVQVLTNSELNTPESIKPSYQGKKRGRPRKVDAKPEIVAVAKPKYSNTRTRTRHCGKEVECEPLTQFKKSKINTTVKKRQSLRPLSEYASLTPLGKRLLAKYERESNEGTQYERNEDPDKIEDELVGLDMPNIGRPKKTSYSRGADAALKKKMIIAHIMLHGNEGVLEQWEKDAVNENDRERLAQRCIDENIIITALNAKKPKAKYQSTSRFGDIVRKRKKLAGKIKKKGKSIILKSRSVRKDKEEGKKLLRSAMEARCQYALEGKQSKLSQTINVLSLAYSKGLVDIKEIHEVGKLKSTHTAIIFNNDWQSIDQDSSSNEIVASVEDRALSSKFPSEIVYEYTNKEMEDLNFAMYATTFGIDVKWACFTRKTFMMPMPSAFPEFYTKSTLIQFKNHIFNAVRSSDKIWSNKGLIRKETCLSEKTKQEIKSELKVIEVVEIESEQYEQLCSQYSTDESPIDDSYYASYGYMGPIALSEEEISFFYQNQCLEVAQEMTEKASCSVSQEDSEQDLIEEELQLEIVNAIEKIKRYNEFKEFWRKLTNLNETSPSYSDCLKKAQELLKEVQKELFQQDIIQIREKFTGIYIDSKSYEATQDKRRIFEQLDNFEQMRVEQEVGALEKKVERIISKKTREEEAKETLEEILDQTCESLLTENEKTTQQMAVSVLATIQVPILEESGKDALHICQTPAPIVDKALPSIPKESAVPVVVETTVSSTVAYPHLDLSLSTVMSTFGYDILESSDVINAIENTSDVLAKISLEEPTTSKQTQAVEEPNIVLEKESQQFEDVVPQETTIKSSVESDALNKEEISAAVKQSILLESDENESVLVGEGEATEKETPVLVAKSISIELDDVENEPALAIAEKEAVPAPAVEVTPSLVVVEKEMEQAFAEKEAVVIEKELEQMPTEKETLLVETEKSINQQEKFLENAETSNENLALVKEIVKQLETKLSIEPSIVAENDELNKPTDCETARKNSVVLKLIENSVPINSNVLSIGEQLNQSGESLFNIENISQIPTEELDNCNTNLTATSHESNLQKRYKRPDSTRSGRFDDSTSGESDIDETDDRPKKIPGHIIKAQLPSTSRQKHARDTYCANDEKDIGAGITVNAPNPDEFIFIVATKYNDYQRKRFKDEEVKEEIFDEIEEEYHSIDNVSNTFEESDDVGHNSSFLDRSSDNEERSSHSEHSNSSLYDPIEDEGYQHIVRQSPTSSNSIGSSSRSSSPVLQVRYYRTPSPQNIEETNHETRNEFCHYFNKSPSPFKSYRVDDVFGQLTSTHFAHRQSPRLVESDENELENDKTDCTTDHYDPDQPPGPGQIHILAEFEEAIDLESYHPPAPVNVMPNSPEICLRDMDESCTDSDELLKIQAKNSNLANAYALFLNSTKFIEEIKEIGYISRNNENICCSPDNLLVKLPWGRQKVITKNKETTSFNPLPDTYNDPNAKPHFSHPDFDPAQKSSSNMFDPMIPQNVSLKQPSEICQPALFDSFAVLEDPLNQWANPQLISTYLEGINHLPLEVQLFALDQVNQYCPFIVNDGIEFNTTRTFDGVSERYPNANLKNFLHINSKQFFLESSTLAFNQIPQPALTQQEVSACFTSENMPHQTEKIIPENCPKESDMFDEILQTHMPLPLSKAESQSFLLDLFYNVSEHGKKQTTHEPQETKEQESPALVEASQTITEMVGGQSEERFFENNGKTVDEVAQKSPIEKLNEESLYLQTKEMAKEFEPEKQILESEEQEPAVIEPEQFIVVQQFAEEQPYEGQYAWDGENMQEGEFEQIPDKLYQLMMRKRPKPNTPQDSTVQSWITTREELNLAGPVNMEVRLTDALRADTIQDVEEFEFEETVLIKILNNEYTAELAEQCNIEEIPGQMVNSLPYIGEEFEAFTNSLKLLSGSDQRFNLLPPAVTLNMWKQVQILANYNLMDYNVHLFCYFVNMEKFRGVLKVLEKDYEGIELTSPSSLLERSPATWSYKALVANIVHQIGGKFVYSRTLETRHSDEIASFYEAEDPVIPIYELKTLKDQVTTLRKAIPDCVYEEGQAELGSKDGLIYIAYVCEKIRTPNSHNYYEKVEDVTEKLIGCHILTGVRGALLHENYYAPYIKLGPFRPFVCDPFNSQPLDIRLNRKPVGVKWDNGYKSPCDFIYYYGLHSPQDYSYYTTFVCSPLVWKPISSHKDIIEEFGDAICENPRHFKLTSWNYLESTCQENVQDEECNVSKDFAHMETFEQRFTPPATNDEEVMAIDEEHDIVKENELIAENIEERIVNKKSPSPKLPLEMDDGTPIRDGGFCTSSDVEDNCSVTSKDFTPSDEDELSSIEADSHEELESRDAMMEEDIMNNLNLLNELEEYGDLEKSQNTSSESTGPEWISQFKKFFRRREKEFTSIVNFSEKIALFTNGDTNSNGLKFKVASAQMQKSKHFKAVIDVIWHYYIIVRVQSAFHMATIVELGFTPTGLIESLMSERNLDDIITEELKNLYESTHNLFNIDHYANLLEYVENKERAFANDSEENKKTFCDSLIYGIIQKTCVCPDLVRVLGKEATPPSWHSFPYLERVDVKNGNAVINNGAKDLNFPDPIEDDFEFWSMEININSIPRMVRFIAERVAKAALEKQHLKDSSSEELISKIEGDLRNPSVFFTKRGTPELEDFNNNIYSAVTYLVVKLYIRTRRFMKDQATIVEKQIVKLNAYWEELANKFSKPPESQIFFDNNPHSFGWKTLKLTESAKPAYKEVTYSDDRSFESSEPDRKKSKNLRAKRSRNNLPKVQEADGCDGDFSSDDADVSRDNLSEGRGRKRGKQDLNDDNISLPSNSDYGSMHEELEVQSNVSLPSISSHSAIAKQAMTMQREELFQQFLNDDDSGFATATSDDLHSPIKKYRSETSAALNKALTIANVSTDLMLPSLSGKESDLPALLRISTKQNLDEQIDINLPDPEFTHKESHQKIRIEVEDQKELNVGFNSLENKEQQPNIGYSSFGNADVSDSPLSKFLNKNKKLLTRRAPRKRIFSKEDQLNTNDEHSATSSEVEDQIQSTRLTTSNNSWTDTSSFDTKDNESNSEVSNSTAQLSINENTDEPSHVELYYENGSQSMKSLESIVSQDEDHEEPISNVQPVRAAGFIKEIPESIKAPTIAELLSSSSIQIPVDLSKELIQAKYITTPDVSFSPNITIHESIIPSPIVEESKRKDPLQALQATTNTVNDSPYDFVYNEPEDNNALPLFPKIESPNTYPTHHIAQQPYSRPEASSNKAIIEILQRPPITDFNTPSRNIINDQSEVPHKIARTSTLLQEEQNRNQRQFNNGSIQGFPFVDACSSGASSFADTMNITDAHRIPTHRTTKKEAIKHGPVIEVKEYDFIFPTGKPHAIESHFHYKSRYTVVKEWPTGTMNIQKSNRCARGKKTNVAPTKEAKIVHRLYMSGKREMKMILRGSKLDFEEMEKCYDEEVRKREEQERTDEANRPLEIQEEYKLHIVNPQLINRPEGIFEDPVPPRSGMITRSVRKSMTQQPKRFIPMSHFENQTPIESTDSLLTPINDPQQIYAESEILPHNPEEQLTQKTSQLSRSSSLEIIEVKKIVQRVQEVQAIPRILLPEPMKLPDQKSPSPDIVTIAVVKKAPRIKNLQEGQDMSHIQSYKSAEEIVENLRIPSLHKQQSALVSALSGIPTLITPSPFHAKDRSYLSTQVVEEHAKAAEELQNKDFLNLNFDSNQISSNVHAKKDVKNLPQNAILQRAPPQERLKDYMSLVAIESVLQNEQPRTLTPSDSPLDLRLRIPEENEKPSDLLLTSQRDIAIPPPQMLPKKLVESEKISAPTLMKYESANLSNSLMGKEKISSFANGETYIPRQLDLVAIIKKRILNGELLLLSKCRSPNVRKLMFIPDDNENSSSTNIIIDSSTRSLQKEISLSPQSQKEQQEVVIEKEASKDKQTISVAPSKDKDSTISKTREHLPPNLPPNVNVLTKAYFKAMSSKNEKAAEPTREMSPSSDDEDKNSTECITTAEPIKVQKIVSQAKSSIQLSRPAMMQRKFSISSQTSDSDNDRLMICEDDEEELVSLRLQPKKQDKTPEKSISTPEISPQQTAKDQLQISNELPSKDPSQTEEISSKEAEQEDDDIFFVLDMKEELEKEARKKALVAYVTPKPELKILYGLQCSTSPGYWSSSEITLYLIYDVVDFVLHNLEIRIFVSDVESTSSLVHISSTVVLISSEDQKQLRLRSSFCEDLCIKMQPNLTKLQSEIEAQVKPSFPDFQLLESQIYKPSKFSKKVLKKIKTEVAAEQPTEIYKRAKRMKKMERIKNIKARLRSTGKRRVEEKLKPMSRSLNTTKNQSQALTVADDDYLFETTV